MAPGARRANVRECLQVLENPDQLGYPGTILSDSQLGYSVYAYQSAEVLFDLIGVRDEILIRIDGLRCKGHKSSETCQKAKLGYCPRCAIPTHIAIPNSFELGEFPIRKQQVMDLWAKHGPWGPRRLAAMKYALEDNSRQGQPPTWDWAARSLHFAFPPPLIRARADGPPEPIITLAETRRRRIRTDMQMRLQPHPRAIEDQPMPTSSTTRGRQ